MLDGPYGVRVVSMDQQVTYLINAAMADDDRSRKWTARTAGIAYSTFQRKLNGGGGWTVDEVVRIAKALSVPAGSLLPEEFGFLAMKDAA